MAGLLCAAGRGWDTWSRIAYGARVSLLVGVAGAVLALPGGGIIGLMAGYFRRLDGVLMRVMDGLSRYPASSSPLP